MNLTAGLNSSLLIGWRDAFPTVKASATAPNCDPSLKRYTCQGRFSFEPSLLSEAARRYSLVLALREPMPCRYSVLAAIRAISPNACARPSRCTANVARDVRMFTIGGGTAQVLRTLAASKVLGWKLPQMRDGYMMPKSNADRD